MGEPGSWVKLNKVYSRVILDRISVVIDPLLCKEQAGFRKGRSCGDHIFTLRQILEQCQEWNTPVYANFVDFEKADIQRKGEVLAKNVGSVGLKINTNKTKALRNNNQTADPITIGGRDIEEVTEFTYLGAKVTTDGNSISEVKARISKARGAFAALKNIWKTNKISNRTTIRLFKSNVLSVLLYEVESWKVTKGICQILEVFQNKCPRRILCIYWLKKKSPTRNSMKGQACSPSLSRLNAAGGNGLDTSAKCHRHPS
ncbi:uncharacterized protein LOC121378097 [Gigantopelta aegis]|uniref:uncharacterized protein LOC121378097 n=1 Tax=Gigantopelta aegis TaxID=1735272 RepID=UPI001B888639|nr:uncharacterized protein LOC121378097 [Gigantopelta aegis]